MQHQARATKSRLVASAALVLLLAALTACSSDLAGAKQDLPASGPDAATSEAASRYLRAAFKHHLTYTGFEITGIRWVHSLKGWSWLTCVRFMDGSHRRTYALFIRDEKVVDARYAVQTDACDRQSYFPFDAMTAAMQPPAHGVLAPLY